MTPELSVQDLMNIHQSAFPYFDKLYKRGAENERYYSADPFTDEQKNEYALDDRIPFSISSIPQKLNSIISTERTVRVSPKVRVRINPDDIPDDPGQMQELFMKEIKADLATLRLKMIESQNAGLYQISDLFASGVAVMFGVRATEIGLSKMGEKIIKLRDVDYRNFMWDVNSTEYEHNDAVWMAEKQQIYRVDLRRQYPDKKVDELTIGDSALQWGRGFTQYYVSYSGNGVSDLDLITVYTHYHKVLRDYYTILFNGQVVNCVRYKDEAEKELRMLQLPYLVAGKDLPPADIIRNPRLMLDKYEFTYTDILEHEETDMELFPYSIYQAFQYKDKIWTMSDILKSMQVLANRILAQIDYAFGIDLDKVLEVEIGVLEGTGVSKEEAIARMKNEGMIFVNQKGGINYLDRAGINPQWVNIMQILIALIDEQGGGKTFSGTANSSNQSGKAIQSLVAQGSLLTSAFVDNRNRFLRDCWEKVLWFDKKYSTAPYVIKIEGGALSGETLQLLQQNQMFAPSPGSPTSGYVKMNADNQNYLADAEFDLEIIEEGLSNEKRESEFADMTAMEQADPSLTLSQTWRKKKIEKISSIGYEDREKISQEIAQAQQAQQQQAQAMQQQQLGIEKAKVLISDKGQQVPEVKKETKEKPKAKK